MVPVSEWTLAEQGSRQVPVVGKEDKREITVLLAVSATGVLLPPQVIYQGKTIGCHAKITFPTGWDITQREPLEHRGDHAYIFRQCRYPILC